MAQEPEQFPRRKARSGLEVRNRAGMGGREEHQPLQVERILKRDLATQPSSRRRSRRRHGGDDAGPWKLGVIVLTGFAAIAVVVLALWYSVIRDRAPVTVEPVGKRIDQDEAEVSSFISNSSPAEIAAAIETTVREFMNAETFEERCRWVRGGQAMREKMEEFYSREGEELPGRFVKIVSRSPLAFGGVPAEVVTVEEEGSEDGQVFSLLPGRDRMLIDWESGVAYGEMSWSELLEKRPVEPVQMRVFVRIEQYPYYNFEFADEEKWQSLRLGTRSASERLHAYVERNSATGREVAAQLGPGRIVPMNVRVKFLPEARERDMVVIDELIHPFWLSPEGLEESLETVD